MAWLFKGDKDSNSKKLEEYSQLALEQYTTELRALKEEAMDFSKLLSAFDGMKTEAHELVVNPTKDRLEVLEEAIGRLDEALRVIDKKHHTTEDLLATIEFDLKRMKRYINLIKHRKGN